MDLATAKEGSEVPNSDDFNALFARAESLARSKRRAEAIACWEQALALRPDDVETLKRLSLVYFPDHIEECLARAKRGVELDSECAASWEIHTSPLGELGAKGSLFAGEIHLQWCIAYLANHPDFGWALLTKAYLLTILSHWEEALATLDRIIELAPRFLPPVVRESC